MKMSFFKENNRCNKEKFFCMKISAGFIIYFLYLHKNTSSEYQNVGIK